MQHKRFIDRGTFLRQFVGNISVECPKCGRHAFVTCPDPPRCYKIKTAVCKHCGYNEKSSQSSWKGPVLGIVKRRCAYCGRSLEKRLNGPIKAITYQLKCSGCGMEMHEPIKWFTALGRNPIDPFFGLPLWFVGNVRGQELWAYNREHLNFIKRLVEASIRIQNPNRNNTLSNRLPKWMLSKKNRSHVLKAIAKLETQND